MRMGVQVQVRWVVLFCPLENQILDSAVMLSSVYYLT